MCAAASTSPLVLPICIIYVVSSATISRATRMSDAIEPLRPFNPADATERRRDEADLAWLRRRLRRDCSDGEIEAALEELALRR
jgi:hypothetical protein